jgi:cytochrome c oxidase subunit 2
LADGSTYKVDENYIRESILYPQAKAVAGYPAMGMPSYQGQLDDDDITGIIEFIKTIDGSQKVEVLQPVVKKTDTAAVGATPVERGKAIVHDTGNLCITCHSIDGSKMVGPSFKGLWGRKEKLSDGSEVLVDEAYIAESIWKPAAKIVEGYGPVMPAMYEGKITEADMKDIIEYLKTLQ